MFITAWRAALVTAGMIALVGTTAFGQRIPPSDSLGRERERFSDPTLPRVQLGPSVFPPPGSIYLPSGTRRHTHSRKRRK